MHSKDADAKPNDPDPEPLWHRAEDEPHLTGSWRSFELWIRRTIGGEFEWKSRPEDSIAMRRGLANTLVGLLRQNDGVFPGECHFLRFSEPRSGRKS